jgi:hypothetical protein
MHIACCGLVLTLLSHLLLSDCCQWQQHTHHPAAVWLSVAVSIHPFTFLLLDTTWLTVQFGFLTAACALLLHQSRLLSVHCALSVHLITTLCFCTDPPLCPLRVIFKCNNIQQIADRQPLVKDRAEYERMHKWSVEDPQDFWAHMAHDYYWAKKVRQRLQILCYFMLFVDVVNCIRLRMLAGVAPSAGSIQRLCISVSALHRCCWFCLLHVLTQHLSVDTSTQLLQPCIYGALDSWATLEQPTNQLHCADAYHITCASLFAVGGQPPRVQL